MACAPALAGESRKDDVTIIPGDLTEDPLDMVAPALRIGAERGENAWREALEFVRKPARSGGGFFDPSVLTREGFRSARKFHTEKYSDSGNGSEMQYGIAADEAIKDGTRITLKRMRLVYFIGEQTSASGRDSQSRKEGAAEVPSIPDSQIRKQGAGGALGPQPAKGKAKKPEPPMVRHLTAGGPAILDMAAVPRKKDPAPPGPRQVKEAGVEEIKQTARGKEVKDGAAGYAIITAPFAVIDTATSSGHATGNVTIEIYGRLAFGAASPSSEPIAVISSEQMSWRTWGEPAVGAKELLLFACADNPGQPDPLVAAHFNLPQEDGSVSKIEVAGRGMIYQFGIYDRLTPKDDDEFRTIGTSLTVHNRAIFHRDIKMESKSVALIPLQEAANPAALSKLHAPLASANRAKAGPAKLAVARSTAAGAAVKERAGRAEPEKLDEILLSRRFEFFNSVTVVEELQPGAQAPPGANSAPTRMSCGHLCLQYPAGQLPGATTLPELMEAFGGVNISRASQAAPDGTPAEPFSINCARVCFDSNTQNIYLAGDAQSPAEIKSGKGEATAPQFCYQQSTQTLVMVTPRSLGARKAEPPKRLVLRPSAPAGEKAPPAAPPGLGFGSGEIVLTWHGGMSREVCHIPVPRKADQIKEILLLQGDVSIQQASPGGEGGLNLRAEKVRLVFDNMLPVGQLEYLESTGDVEVGLGEMRATGQRITVDLKYGPDGLPVQKHIHVRGADEGKKAILYKGNSAVRAGEFFLDGISNTFRCEGGVVAVVRGQEDADKKAKADEKQPKTPGAPAAASLPVAGISFDPQGDLFLQCDGELSQDSSGKLITITGNVLVRQGDKQLLADEVKIVLGDPPASSSDVPAAPPPATAGLMAGALKSLQCRGNVEMLTGEQLVQCDKLHYDADAGMSLLEVNDPEDEVRVYSREEAGGTRFIGVRKSLRLFTSTGAFQPGGAMWMFRYSLLAGERADSPAPRGRQNSPIRMRISPAQERP